MKFPSWIRKDPNCVVLPYLVFRNGAGPVGGIARHQHIVRDHAVLGMVVHAEITAPPVAVFVRGTHEVGSFVDLLGQRQYDTEQKTKPDNKFWIIHGCIFRSAFGQVTSGEMVDPSSGIRTILPDCDPNLAITLHPAPFASTRDDQDRHISEIQGKESAETCELLKPISGADNHGVRTLVLSEVRFAVFTYLFLPGIMHTQEHVKGGSNSSHLASPARLISSKAVATFLRSAASKRMRIPISGAVF